MLSRATPGADRRQSCHVSRTASTIAAFAKWGYTDQQGMGACFVLNALSFLVVIYALMSLRVKHMPPTEVRRTSW